MWLVSGTIELGWLYKVWLTDQYMYRFIVTISIRWMHSTFLYHSAFSEVKPLHLSCCSQCDLWLDRSLSSVHLLWCSNQFHKVYFGNFAFVHLRVSNIGKPASYRTPMLVLALRVSSSFKKSSRYSILVMLYTVLLMFFRVDAHVCISSASSSLTWQVLHVSISIIPTIPSSTCLLLLFSQGQSVSFDAYPRTALSKVNRGFSM